MHNNLRVPLIIRICCLSIGFLMFTGSLYAETYRCITNSGSVVLTDSPAQLEHCTLIDLKQAPTPNSKGYGTIPSQPAISKSNPSPRGAPHPNDQNSRSTQSALDRSPFDSDQPGESSQPIHIPVTKQGGSLIVHARLNRTKEVSLILDTGATMTVLSYTVAMELGLLNGSDTSVSTVNTAGGSVQVNLARMETVQVGPAEVKNVAVAIHDLPNSIPGVAGLLGMSFLNHFLVTLDSTNGVLVLQHR